MMPMILRGQPTCNTTPTTTHARPNHLPNAKERYNLEVSTDRSLGETKVVPDCVPQRKAARLGRMNRITEKDHSKDHSTESAAAKGVQDLGPYTGTNGMIELHHDYRDNNHNNHEHALANHHNVGPLASAMRK
jgi:hypothetical protein